MLVVGVVVGGVGVRGVIFFILILFYFIREG